MATRNGRFSQVLRCPLQRELEGGAPGRSREGSRELTPMRAL